MPLSLYRRDFNPDAFSFLWERRKLLCVCLLFAPPITYLQTSTQIGYFVGRSRRRRFRRYRIGMI